MESGTASASTFLRGDNTWQSIPGSQWTSGANTISYTGGSVGIGTANPSAQLFVAGLGPGGTAVFTGSVFASHFNYNGDGSEDTYIRGGKNSSRVVINDQGTANVLLSPLGGNVGIGTATPGARLDVVGNVNVGGTGNITATGTIEGGNIKAKYQDVAEWVESSQSLPWGTLVVLDQTKSNQVIASSQAYDTRIAGVISERPGITLGEGGHNKVLVATTGRVKLMVDASKGPVQIGDLLVTSDIPGVAMKSEAINIGGIQIHRPGTLVGKALEPLAKGQGQILVLLSLQ